MTWDKIKDRYSIIIIIALLISFIYTYKLLQLQIVKGEEYMELSQQRLRRLIPAAAPRGEIFDRYGRPLLVNKMGFSVQIFKSNISEEQFNNTILELIKLLEENEEFYTDTLPISYPPFEFTFSESEKLSKKDRELNWKKTRDIPAEYTPIETIEILKKKYGISKKYNDIDTRKNIGIRYEMDVRGFGVNTPFTIASDINLDTVMQIEERHFDFPGVNIVTEYTRNYVYDELAAHILGRTDIIYKDEYEVLKNKGYGMNDIIGKDGIEKVAEKDLKGKDGTKSIEQNIDGKLIQVVNAKPYIPGNNVILTIDIELQKVAEEALKRTIEDIRLKGRITKQGQDADSGAVVVIDVNTGEVLAMATYPTYNPKNFKEEYNNLYKDPLKPMLNRAISGAYAPASTFKMLTAIAALEENIINKDTRIKDQGVYRYYQYDGPRCWIYSPRYGYRTHGNINVSEAIRDSCNYFFYDVGRRLKIENLLSYGKQFGLGEYTGIELPAESKGIFASPEYKSTVSKEQWWPGETLSAAIGQMHIFTPLQLANYVATLANGGNRYRPYLIKHVKTYDEGKMVRQTEPETINKINLKEENLKAVLEGMKSVTQEDGTASHVFLNFPIEVAGKTGTAEVSRGTSDGIFVGFAPYDKPQIAVAAIIEHGGSGGNTAPIIKEIFTDYLDIGKKQQNYDFPTNRLVE